MSGVLSTVQQVGNAFGVAIVGMVCFRSLDGGYAHAMVRSPAVLTATTTAVAALAS